MPRQTVSLHSHPGAYQVYSISAPTATHWRPASCADVACPAYLNGWRLRVEDIPAELAQLARRSGRRYVELDVAAGERWLVFEPGQPCFKASEHRRRIDRPELYLARSGLQARPYVHSGPDAWVNDFGTNQERVRALREG